MNNKVFLKTFAVGDVHNQWIGTIGKHVRQFHDDIQRAKRMDVGNIGYIQVGDFGIGHTNDIREDVDRLVTLNKILEDHLSYLYIIRGNHDDPSWFKDENYKQVKEMLTNIMFVEDYTVLNLNLEDILFVGGATSIDRIPNRKKPYPAYWTDEGFFYDIDKIKKLGNIDRVITHNAPEFCPPQKFSGIVYDYAQSFDDRTLLDDLTSERRALRDLYSDITFNNKNKVKSWFYGHYHRSATFDHDGCVFRCLNINEFVRI